MFVFEPIRVKSSKHPPLRDDSTTNLEFEPVPIIPIPRKPPPFTRRFGKLDEEKRKTCDLRRIVGTHSVFLARKALDAAKVKTSTVPRTTNASDIPQVDSDPEARVDADFKEAVFEFLADSFEAPKPSFLHTFVLDRTPDPGLEILPYGSVTFPLTADCGYHLLQALRSARAPPPSTFTSLAHHHYYDPFSQNPGDFPVDVDNDSSSHSRYDYPYLLNLPGPSPFPESIPNPSISTELDHNSFTIESPPSISAAHNPLQFTNPSWAGWISGPVRSRIWQGMQDFARWEDLEMRFERIVLDGPGGCANGSKVSTSPGAIATLLIFFPSQHIGGSITYNERHTHSHRSILNQKHYHHRMQLDFDQDTHSPALSLASTHYIWFFNSSPGLDLQIHPLGGGYRLIMQYTVVHKQERARALLVRKIREAREEVEREKEYMLTEDGMDGEDEKVEGGHEGVVDDELDTFGWDAEEWVEIVGALGFQACVPTLNKIMSIAVSETEHAVESASQASSSFDIDYDDALLQCTIQARTKFDIVIALSQSYCPDVSKSSSTQKAQNVQGAPLKPVPLTAVQKRVQKWAKDWSKALIVDGMAMVGDMLACVIVAMGIPGLGPEDGFDLLDEIYKQHSEPSSSMSTPSSPTSLSPSTTQFTSASPYISLDEEIASFTNFLKLLPGWRELEITREWYTDKVMATYASLDLAPEQTTGKRCLSGSKNEAKSKTDAKVDGEQDHDNDDEADNEEPKTHPLDMILAVVKAPEWRFIDVRLMLETHLEDKDADFDDPPSIIFPVRVELLTRLIEYFCGAEFEEKLGSQVQIDLEEYDLSGINGLLDDNDIILNGKDGSSEEGQEQENANQIQLIDFQRSKVRQWCLYRIKHLLHWLKLKTSARAIDLCIMARSAQTYEGQVDWITVLVGFVKRCEVSLSEAVGDLMEGIWGMFERQVRLNLRLEREWGDGDVGADGDWDIRIENREDEHAQERARVQARKERGGMNSMKDTLHMLSKHIVPFISALRSSLQPQTFLSSPYTAFAAGILALITSTLFPNPTESTLTPPLAPTLRMFLVPPTGDPAMDRFLRETRYQHRIKVLYLPETGPVTDMLVRLIDESMVGFKSIDIDVDVYVVDHSTSKSRSRSKSRASSYSANKECDQLETIDEVENEELENEEDAPEYEEEEEDTTNRLTKRHSILSSSIVLPLTGTSTVEYDDSDYRDIKHYRSIPAPAFLISKIAPTYLSTWNGVLTPDMKMELEGALVDCAGADDDDREEQENGKGRGLKIDCEDCRAAKACLEWGEKVDIVTALVNALRGVEGVRRIVTNMGEKQKVDVMTVVDCALRYCPSPSTGETGILMDTSNSIKNHSNMVQENQESWMRIGSTNFRFDMNAFDCQDDLQRGHADPCNQQAGAKRKIDDI